MEEFPLTMEESETFVRGMVLIEGPETRTIDEIEKEMRKEIQVCIHHMEFETPDEWIKARRFLKAAMYDELAKLTKEWGW